MSLSVVISTHNSTDVLEECLKSIRQLADEIIIIDNESMDDTVKIAKKYTKNIHHHKNNPLILNQAKNFGFTKAKSEWILNLDPDERVSPELAKEIHTILHNPVMSIAGYQMPRQNIIFGKWIQHGLWYPDYQTRLFRRSQGRFPEKHNHEKLEVKSSLGSLSGHLIHYNYTSVTQYIDKINHLYSDNEAKNLIDSGKKVVWYDAIRMPLTDFITNFFARESYKDGLHGLVLSILQAFYTFVVFAKIWEYQKFKQYQSQRFLSQCRTEFETKLQEFSYWYHQKQGLKGLNRAPTSRLLTKILPFLKNT